MAAQYNTVSESEAKASVKAVFKERLECSNPKTIAQYEARVKRHWQASCLLCTPEIVGVR